MPKIFTLDVKIDSRKIFDFSEKTRFHPYSLTCGSFPVNTTMLWMLRWIK